VKCIVERFLFFVKQFFPCCDNPHPDNDVTVVSEREHYLSIPPM
jgi:hypothetical protein